MFNFSLAAMNKLVASDTSNYYTPNEGQIGQGIVLNSDLVSNVANSLWYKTSAGIQFIQEFGGLLWMPEKHYKVGSIVWVNCVVAGNNTLIPLKCTKNSPGQQYCKENPITDSLTKEENGYCYFTGNTINTTYWTSVLIDTNVSNNLTVTPQGSSTGTLNSDLKFVKLIDFNSNSELIEGDFVIKIERDNKLIMASIHVHAYKNEIIEIIVKDVLSNAYSGVLGASNSIWISGSPFKDLALLGCILSVDQDKNLYLNILNSQASGTVKISTELQSGNLSLTLNEVTKSYTWYNDISNVIIPFINGASNTFTGCGEAKTYLGKPTAEYVFRNGLLRVIENSSPNQFLYPSIQKTTQSTSLPNIRDRYLVDVDNSNDIAEELPNIKYEKPLVTRAYGVYRTFVNDWQNFIYDTKPEETADKPNAYLVEDQTGTSGAFYFKPENTRDLNPNIGGGSWRIQGSQAGNEIAGQKWFLRECFDASKSNPIYKESGKIKPLSRGVYIYQKVW